MSDTAAEPSSTRPGIATLAGRDADLSRVVEAYGPPPAWLREPGASSLVLFVLEQQISLDAARAHHQRLLAASGGAFDPDRVLALDDEAMLAAGISRQKRRYVRGIAEAMLDGSLDLDAVAAADDDEARRLLTALLGVGAWTADCYLLFCLDRPDVWPIGDIALQQAAAEVLERDTRLTAAELAAAGEVWRPYRSDAARILWHHYLNTRGRGAGPA